MTTTIDTKSLETPMKRRLLAAMIAAELVLSSAAPAWAQRRRGEPEANPSFQQGLQQSGGSGGPMEPESGGGASSAGSDGGSRGPVQGVQIGTSQPKPAAPERVAPLDARVTVRVKGAPLATFLDTISAQAKVNFIITEGLEQKRVTAFLQNVTVREALQVLLEIKGLTYQQIGRSNTYVVTPRSKTIENLITRIYTLSYIPLIPLGSADSEQKSITPTVTGGSVGSSGGGGAGGPSSPAGGASERGGTATSGSDVAIVTVLTSILSKNGKVSVEPRTNSLIVTDIPEVFPQVEQIIAELDKKAPQVVIEAQIVEIDSTRSKDLGIEWGGTHGELASFTGGQRDTVFPMRLPSDLSKARFLDPIAPGSVISNIGGGGGSDSSSGSVIRDSFIKTSILDLTALQITLRALVSRSEARFLGKPKILTLNNKTAIIQIAQMQATSVSQQQASAGGASSIQGNSVERTQTGLILKVTPQVNKDGYITMLVQPSFTDVTPSDLGTSANKIFDAISRGASSLVRVKNGQTLVLGGLLQSKEGKVVRKVPFLGYIPLIGWLFTSLSSTRRNSDLVIFITPTIVSD